MKKVFNFKVLFIAAIIVLSLIVGFLIACKDNNGEEKEKEKEKEIDPLKGVERVSLDGNVNTSAKKGGTLILSAEVTGILLSEEDKEVTWSIVETNKKDGTFIVSTGINTGKLFIANDESLQRVTIRAVSVFNEEKSDSIFANISGQDSVNNGNTGMLTMTATTSLPRSSLFIQNSVGDDYIEITVRGINGYTGSSFWLDYRINDVFGALADQGSLEFHQSQGNNQSKRISIDKSRLGYFSFVPSIPGGAPGLPEVGSHPAGFSSFCVVIDPAQRRQKAPYGHPDVDKYMYFGMFMIPWENYLGYDMFEILGIDNAIGGPSWRNTVTGNQNSGATNVNALNNYFNSNTSFIYQGPHYYWSDLTSYMPKWARTEAGYAGSYGGELSPYGEQEFVKFIEGVAKLKINNAPLRPYHYYQILWEPVDYWNGWSPWGNWYDFDEYYRQRYQGGDKALVRVYELAYKTIHALYDAKAVETGDNSWRSKAVVLGPTYSSIGNDYWDGLYWHENLFKLGLFEYMDGLSIHPYEAAENSQSAIEGSVSSMDDFAFANQVQRIVNLCKKYYNERTNPKRHAQPFFWGTEQGMTERVFWNGSRRPVLTSQMVTRQSLIMMGEGFDVNMMFAFADYDQGCYGFFYNLTNSYRLNADGTIIEVGGEQYMPQTVSPKPAAPAMTTMSYLLKGYKSAGRITTLTGRNFGYKFEDTESNNVIYAIWNDQLTRTINLNVGANTVTVYDMMGNSERRSSPGGVLSITLDGFVQYVKVGQ